MTVYDMYKKEVCMETVCSFNEGEWTIIINSLAKIKVTHRPHLCNKWVVPEHMEESSKSQDNLSIVRESLRGASITAYPKTVQQSFVVKQFMSLCQGLTKSAKFQRKDQSVEGSTSKCLFLLFQLISCISLVFLIEIWSFCSNLLGNYPAHKMPIMPHWFQ